ncbi:hypothetical protein BOSE62_160276 [Bosea sp. 62]|nr:hypothetical protein BOSE46_10038 [Bosea sp. 46]CAD5248267.1 hypothetical protein BOSE21B_10244 [Bosea sp. 21B]CAD5267707.1 hypothetical protein BOSE7B_150893 [Bosea sp. 7B]VVT45521.1 hypothetical protein BOS5A_10833 [Bosea sp. EC-HK365B]VXA94123.1 hypothetical protein BOSE29B_10038 [Bosea sp. 29B]VXA94747.1 hypothetical protein BOSE125_10038 [Bosea sp. 125]VXB95197.1 hypothetical protein BOSE62_160276 [Bosea sp. 62]VXC57774.1 hypothetical protein BOSE127_190521 [Bosea sp. 127]
MRARPYTEYCQAFSLLRPERETETKLNRLVNSITKNDTNRILAQLYAVYSKLPPIDEGPHQLEGAFDKELRQIEHLHESLRELIHSRDSSIPIVMQIELCRCLRWIYERKRSLEPRM